MQFSFIGTRFSLEAFGCGDFSWHRADDEFGIFSSRAGGVSVSCGERQVFHGTTLAQFFDICRAGFKVGLYMGPGTTSSSHGIWVCETAGHALDRCALLCGYFV